MVNRTPTPRRIDPPLTERPYLTVAQAARVLQVSAEHVHRMIRAGMCPGASKVLGVWRIRTAELLGAGR